jgi:hypothetical protein
VTIQKKEDWYAECQTFWADYHMRDLRGALSALNVTLGKLVLDEERLEELRRAHEALGGLVAFAEASSVQHGAREVA